MKMHHLYRWGLGIVVGLVVTAGRAQAINVGVAGDSYADEYQFYPPDRTHARNFVEILSALRGVNFGAFTTADRGDPRHQGFAYDYGLSGAATGDLASQATGIASEVAAGNIQYALLFIGGNDFLNALQAGNPAALPGVVTTALANVTSAVGKIEAAGNVKVVVATVPDVQLLPDTLLAEQLGILPKSFANAASQAEAAYNTDLKAAFAGNANVAIDDFSAQATTAFSQPLSFGGVTLTYPQVGDSYTDAFLADGVHPGTIIQGVLANSFISTLDSSFNAGIAPLTPAEIVTYAKAIDAASAVPLPEAWKMVVGMLPVVAGMWLVKAGSSLRGNR